MRGEGWLSPGSCRSGAGASMLERTVSGGLSDAAGEVPTPTSDVSSSDVGEVSPFLCLGFCIFPRLPKEVEEKKKKKIIIHINKERIKNETYKIHGHIIYSEQFILQPKRSTDFTRPTKKIIHECIIIRLHGAREANQF